MRNHREEQAMGLIKRIVNFTKYAREASAGNIPIFERCQNCNKNLEAWASETLKQNQAWESLLKVSATLTGKTQIELVQLTIAGMGEENEKTKTEGEEDQGQL